MSFFSKIKSFFSLANVALVDANTNSPIGAETEQELSNSLEFHQLLQDGQAELVASYRTEVAELQDLVQAQNERIAELETSFNASLQAIENRLAEVAQQTTTAENTAKDLAGEMNKIKGQPLVKSASEDQTPELLSKQENEPQYTAQDIAKLMRSGFLPK